MSDFKAGQIGWVDLSVPDAPRLRDFYSAVVGWDSAPLSMGDYDDYNMLPPKSGAPVAGICHALGKNALPPVWLIYITVADLDESLTACARLGGRRVSDISEGEWGRFAVIEDPAGAFSALYQPAGATSK
jgi:uncharacterized protein